MANNVRDCICKNKTYQECREQFTNPGPKVSVDCMDCLENCDKINNCEQCFEDSDGNKTFFKLWQNNQSMMCYNNMTDHMVPNIGEKNSPWCGIVEKMKCNLKETYDQPIESQHNGFNAFNQTNMQQNAFAGSRFDPNLPKNLEYWGNYLRHHDMKEVCPFKYKNGIEECYD